jgi:diguanylate cyclase (GGDEF)-like protein/PAS domain S-box-containing protein
VTPAGRAFLPEIGLDRIAQAIPGILYVYDVPAGQLIYANESAAETLGYDAQVLREMGPGILETLLDPEDFARLPMHLEELQRLPPGDALETEFRVRRCDGEWRWMLARHAVFQLLPSGEPKTIFGIALDITDRRVYGVRLRFQDELLDAVQQAVIATDLSGRITYWNPGAVALFGLIAAEAIGKPLHEVAEGLALEDQQALIEAARNGQPWTGRSEILTRSGAAHSVRITASGILDSSGHPIGVAEVFEDITQQVAFERDLASSRERYRLAMDGSNDAIWDWDLDQAEIFFSHRWAQIIGSADSEQPVEPEEWFRHVHPDDLPLLRAALDAHLTGRTNHLVCEYRLRGERGQERWILCRGLVVRDAGGKLRRIAGSQTDISARKQIEEQLRRAALHDSLTGLPNRALLLDRLAERIKAARQRRRGPFALLFVDLDRFKFVNDSLGHEYGDELLVLTARRIASRLTEGDTLARFGGDEFLVLLDEAACRDDAETAVRALKDAFSEPFPLAGRQVYAGASIGLTMWDDTYGQPDDMVRDADAAMYRVKNLGRIHPPPFTQEVDGTALSQLMMDSNLRRAIGERRFQAWYQPIVALADNSIACFEALARWPQDAGIAEAGTFINSAEETGLIGVLDREIFEQAMRHHARARRVATRLCRISINLSGRTLFDAGFPLRACRLCESLEVPASEVCFEISERLPQQAANAVLPVLQSLRTQGFVLALDDCGIGSASLRQILMFPLNVIKIDRSFLQEMEQGSNGFEIVKMMISLGHSLGLEVVGEGIETERQVEILRALGCDYAQGFHFWRALEEHEAISLLEERKSLSARLP